MRWLSKGSIVRSAERLTDELTIIVRQVNEMSESPWPLRVFRYDIDYTPADGKSLMLRLQREGGNVMMSGEPSSAGRRMYWSGSRWGLPDF